jgi:fluoride exporter
VNAVLMVAAGGALGSVARYALNSSVTRALGEAFPWGILIANVLGCFLMGLLGAYFMQRVPEQEATRLFLTTGYLGGFTTFSAFSFDVLKLINGGQNSAAVLYVFASVGLSLLAVFAGFLLVKA